MLQADGSETAAQSFRIRVADRLRGGMEAYTVKHVCPAKSNRDESIFPDGLFLGSHCVGGRTRAGGLDRVKASAMVS